MPDDAPTTEEIAEVAGTDEETLRKALKAVKIRERVNVSLHAYDEMLLDLNTVKNALKKIEVKAEHLGEMEVYARSKIAMEELDHLQAYLEQMKKEKEEAREVED